MRTNDLRGRVSGALWGVFMMALGSIFLFQQLGLADWRPFWHWWPLVLVLLGLGQFVDRKPGEGVLFLLLGLWMFAVTFDVMGLTYRNSWPIALIAVGASMVVQELNRKAGVQAPSQPGAGESGGGK